MRFLFALLLITSFCAHAGAQKEEALSTSVRSMLQKSISDTAPPKLMFPTQLQADLWLNDMSRRLGASQILLPGCARDSFCPANLNMS